ncbi:MAG: HAD family hydrolase [Nitriliruptoraceae bacterium]
MRHVVWDWNGTLLDDQPLVIEGLNAALAAVGQPPIDLATYQRLYTRPVQVFYERLLGRPISPGEWETIDARFHTGYHAALDRAELTDDAHVALDAVVRGGDSQSLLSMFPHDQLLPLVERFGLDARFVVVDGLRGDGGGVKAPHLRRHLDRVAAALSDPADEVVVIGDALDDAAAAAQVGVACVLYDGGSHPRGELEQTGVPVVDSLSAAVLTAVAA